MQKLEIKLIDRKVAKEKLTDGQSNLLFSNQAHAMDGAIHVNFHVNFFKDHKLHLLVHSNCIYSCLFIPNCTQNHLTTYTSWMQGKVLMFLTHED